MKFRRRKDLKEVVELNITAFMNLMVILVPFLLITAVFSRMTILELNLPVLGAQNSSQQNVDLALQLVIRENSFDIQDEKIGLIHKVARNPQAEDWKTFSQVLLEIKSRFPKETAITLLLEPGISYKTMIEVMDHVRFTTIVNVATAETIELFPDVSIGDAPELSIMGQGDARANPSEAKP